MIIIIREFTVLIPTKWVCLTREKGYLRKSGVLFITLIPTNNFDHGTNVKGALHTGINYFFPYLSCERGCDRELQ